MYNNTYTIGELLSNTDYLIFKKGIRPEWEDPHNKDGGKWVVTLPIEDDMEEEVDKAWLQLLLHITGGFFERKERDLINGMIFSIRDKHLRMSLWCNSSTEVESIKVIGKKFKQISNLDKKYKFVYQIHYNAAVLEKRDNSSVFTIE